MNSKSVFRNNALTRIVIVDPRKKEKETERPEDEDLLIEKKIEMLKSKAPVRKKAASKDCGKLDLVKKRVTAKVLSDKRKIHVIPEERETKRLKTEGNTAKSCGANKKMKQSSLVDMLKNTEGKNIDSTVVVDTCTVTKNIALKSNTINCCRSNTALDEMKEVKEEKNGNPST